MISLLTGLVKECKESHVVLEVNGIGFGVFVPHEHECVLHSLITLHIYMYWHQENGPALYGFATLPEKALFEVMLSCSGVGPRLALAILSHLSPSAVASAIVTGDGKALCAIDGIGPKKAETIMVHCRDKITKLLKTGIIVEDSGISRAFRRAAEALEGLHYNKQEIAEALDFLKKMSWPAEVMSEDLIKKALVFLSRRT